MIGGGFVFATAKTGLGAGSGGTGFGTAGVSTTLVAPRLNDKNSPLVSAGEKIAPAGCGVAQAARQIAAAKTIPIDLDTRQLCGMKMRTQDVFTFSICDLRLTRLRSFARKSHIVNRKFTATILDNVSIWWGERPREPNNQLNSRLARTLASPVAIKMIQRRFFRRLVCDATFDHNIRK
jgi:hypothetical protein